MALTIETGAGVPGADSYVTLSEARAFASSRGVTLPTVDGELEVLLRKATDYLESLTGSYKGSRTNASQPLQWPRTGVYLYAEDTAALAGNVIPDALKKAQSQLAIEAKTADLAPTSTGRAVRLKTIGPITTEYEPGQSATGTPTFPKVDTFLGPLRNQSAGSSLTSIRV